eukprot:4891665-Prymnesium_polylepis.1
MADPSVEHARLACALGHAPPPPASPPPRGNGPPVAASDRTGHEIDAKAIQKAVVAALAKKGLGAGNDGKSNRQKKSDEHNLRGRLPDGKRWKAGTCNFDHDTKHPGK